MQVTNTKLTLVLMLVSVLVSCSRPAVTEMRCEYLESPIGVDTRSPRFTWNITGADGFIQKSFALEVMSEDGQYSWNSGKVESNLMNYQPVPLDLKPCTSYVWSIEVESEDGCTVSGSSTFETAMFNSSDWVATWIYDGKSADEESAPVLRKSFMAGGKIAKARLYVSAAAYADILINGRRVSSTALNPGFTTYNKRNLYNTYDVTDLIEQGENVILATLGNGLYDLIDRDAVWDFELAPWRGRPRMIAELHVVYETGRETIFATDESWRYLHGSGPVVMDNIYSGDHIDAGLADNAMALPGYDGGEWMPAVQAPAPSNVLQSQYMGTFEIDKAFHPVEIKSFGDTVYVCDFGVNMTGGTALEISGEPGTVVKVQHGETLDENGRLTVEHMNEHFRPLPGHEFQTDVFVLGDGEFLFEPKFNFHGFRYAEVVSDKPITLLTDDVTAKFEHTAFRPVSTFKSSESEFDAIRELANHTYLCNAVSIPTDCPQREKNGWTADAEMACEIGTFNFDVANFYLKYIDDMVDSQTESGSIASIAPTSGWGQWINPVWDAALFVIPEAVYNCYGDIRAIEKVLVPCEKYLAFIQTRENADGVLTDGLGDWCPYDTVTPNDFTSTCYHYMMNMILARFERILGRDDSKYVEKAESIKKTLNERYLDRETAIYANGSQCALALALYAGIVPDDMVDAVAASLSEAVTARDGYADFGMIGTKTVLRMLTKYGYADQAYEMVMKEDAPSWRNWVRMGYTTMLEQWVAEPGVSLSKNHVFFGDVDAWMINDIAGINYDPEQPGFSHIIIRPHFVKGLKNASATFDSVAGEIVSEWDRTSSRTVRLHVEIPDGTTATIVAGNELYEVKSGKYNYRIWQ